jgi:hypothetical protein
LTVAREASGNVDDEGANRAEDLDGDLDCASGIFTAVGELDAARAEIVCERIKEFFLAYFFEEEVDHLVCAGAADYVAD